MPDCVRVYTQATTRMIATEKAIKDRYTGRIASKETVTEEHTLPQLRMLPRAYGWK